MKSTARITVLLVVFSSLNSFAQEPTDIAGDQGKDAPREQDEASAATADTSKELSSLEKRLTERIDKLENENQAQKREIEELRAADEMQMDDEEFGAFESEAGEKYEVDSMFSVYGFFDLTFLKIFTDDDNLQNMELPTSSTFVMNNVNLYFLSKMTKSLQALVELRFTFLPHGSVQESESVAKIGDTEFRPGGEDSDCESSENVVCTPENTSKYVRVDNTVLNPITAEELVLGGVLIERVHLTYSPFEWLNILAGRYLTPYGIWNIDHGSPVVIPVRVPYIQTSRMVPLAQTGLQVYGRFFAATTLFFDYAVTLSNGRGPIDQLFDLDENKGAGLRLRLTHQKKPFRISLGGYGYYGTYTDSKKTVVLEMNPDGTVRQDVDYPLGARVTVTESYKEYVVATDLLVELYGLKLQAEYIHRYINFTTPGIIPPEDLIDVIGINTETVYKGNFEGNGVYALLAWQLPLSEWQEMVLITPYLMYERGDPNDTDPGYLLDIIQAGLNVKPSSFVTLKAEYAYVKPSEEAVTKDSHYVLAQVAVSF